MAGPSSSPVPGSVSTQPSWGRLGLEFVTDLVGWLIVLGVLDAVGSATLDKITKNLFGELVLILVLFFAVTVIVRIGFIVLARRALA